MPVSSVASVQCSLNVVKEKAVAPPSECWKITPLNTADNCDRGMKNTEIGEDGLSLREWGSLHCFCLIELIK